MKKRMISVIVYNQNAILTRLMGLFTKHQFQIESLAAAEYKELKEFTKVSIIVEAEDDHKFLQLVKQINKQIDVLSATDITDQNVISRELALIKKVLV
ncbi:acetolactate synthase small subunit [Bacillus sp. CMF12]|uniref:acetolactate synthase small subunit n=1 Tax=Bacillaceae TaxID=186817 RepID=UPI001FB40A92|nr:MULTISPECIES: acetolactate synthase small subunit [Bacillaceae]UOE57389.1 acetolactate synthase small subunit [Cytobacillus oceanisediminis]USK51849.1 acetolactate synthase small subunit [Bacillus sp. CMF12]